MCSVEQFKIDLKRLTDEVTTLDFDLDNHFFAALDGSELRQGTLHVSVSVSLPLFCRLYYSRSRMQG